MKLMEIFFYGAISTMNVFQFHQSCNWTILTNKVLNFISGTEFLFKKVLMVLTSKIINIDCLPINKRVEGKTIHMLILIFHRNNLT